MEKEVVRVPLGWGPRACLLVAALALALVAGCGGDDDGGGEAVGTEPEVPATPVELEAELEDRLVEAAEDSDGKNVDAQCFGLQRCLVTYEVEITGIDTDFELVEAQRDVWAEMFSESSLKTGAITLRGPTTTVGGKEETSDILRVDCNRSAARQIDWENVDKEGLEILCDWQELVRFD